MAGADGFLGGVTARDRALAHVAARSEGPALDRSHRVTVHFHPDRFVLDDRSASAGALLVIEALARDGRYRCQFETGTSNGGLTAHPGGDRWRWESRIFGAAYDAGPAADRPKYGSLNFRRRAVGGSPRFGSAHLRLHTHVLDRTTFCYPDSVTEPVDFGVAGRMSLLALAAADRRDRLDDYVEAHVHGPLCLDRDVEAVVLDPCFAGTRVEVAAAQLGCPVEWHPGFRLSVTELRRNPTYRGLEFVELGCALAVDGQLDARILGDAARSGRHDPDSLKRVWHYVARFGAPDG